MARGNQGRMSHPGWLWLFFSRPNAVAAAMEATGALFVAAFIPLQPRPSVHFLVFVCVAVAALLSSAVRITAGKYFPTWTLHIDVAAANLAVSVLTATAVAEHLDLANLFLLVEIFALLYLPVRSALVHLATGGAAYATVLILAGPTTGGPDLVDWITVFGLGTVIAVVVVGLTSVLRRTAAADPLTGLANRRSWDERLDVEFERSRRSGEALSVVVIDIDDFKGINDARGHQAGDQVLRAAADCWRGAIRGSTDFLARLGGDEFGIIAAGSDESAARFLAGRLSRALPEGISASGGAATWNRVESESDLVRRADQAMYEAKQLRRRTPAR